MPAVLQVDPLDRVFRPADGLPAWPLLLPPENISRLVIVDKVDPSALNTDVPADPVDLEAFRREPLPAAEPPFGPDPEVAPAGKENSAQSLVTYSTVLPHDPQQPPGYKDSSNSSDEGNFSANNSDISGSFQGGLWELDDPRRSCSFNSVEQLSAEASEPEDEGRGDGDLFYLGYAGDASEEEEDQTDSELLKMVPAEESRPLLAVDGPCEPPPSSLRAAAACSVAPFYLPQFTSGSHGGEPQP